MFDNLNTVFGNDGSVHNEFQIGPMRQTLGEPDFETVIPIGDGMSTVFRSDGTVDTEYQIGNMRQTLGESGFETIF